MTRIIVEGERYEVIETLGFHQMGKPAKVVRDGMRERVAIKEGSGWHFHKPQIIPGGYVPQ